MPQPFPSLNESEGRDEEDGTDDEVWGKRDFCPKGKNCVYTKRFSLADLLSSLVYVLNVRL